MKQKLKQIAENTFYQLLIVYTLLMLLIALGFFSKYTFQFQIFAVIIGFFGISILFSNKTEQSKPINKKLHYFLFALAIILIIFLKSIPYLGNSIPLGYDAGIYKYGIEHGLQNLDNWILSGGFEPGFLYLVTFLHTFLSSQFILTTLLIILSTILGIAVYFVVKEFSDAKTGLIALFIYAFSIVQFKAFSMMYYKNILGMILILFSILYLAKYEKAQHKKRYLFLFIILGGLLGAIHRPSFYIFGLSFLFYALISPYKNKKYNFKKLGKNLACGILIIAIAGVFYIGKFSPAITNMIDPIFQGFIQPGESPGTFINFFTFQFSSLFYLPLALLGLFYFIKKKDFNILVIWAVINFAIVYFQFFFFDRMIIFLDLVLIIFASIGFSAILKDTKKIGAIIIIILLLSAGIMTFNEARNTKPGISQTQLDLIQQLNQTEQNASVMSISSQYSPYVLGYSDRKTIAPGLFDANLWNQDQWQQFWTTNSTQETKGLMQVYSKPIYLFAGNKNFNNPCFSLYLEQDSNKIYKYTC